MSSAVRGTPEGIPSRMAIRPFPWDSPPFRYRSMRETVLRLLLDDRRGHEDQQLSLVDGHTLVLEQPAEEGDTVEPRHALGRVAASFFEDPADHCRLAVPQEDFRRGLLLVDRRARRDCDGPNGVLGHLDLETDRVGMGDHMRRSEEHTSELQSRPHLVCRLLLEKKKKRPNSDRVVVD